MIEDKIKATERQKNICNNYNDKLFEWIQQSGVNLTKLCTTRNKKAKITNPNKLKTKTEKKKQEKNKSNSNEKK